MPRSIEHTFLAKAPNLSVDRGDYLSIGLGLFAFGGVVSGKSGRFECGEKHPGWKGGRTKDGEGYIRVRINGAYVKEHTFVMENHIGRPLGKNECVHHKNERRDDNRLCNLKIMDKAEHSRHHNLGRKWSEESKARSRKSRIGMNHKEAHNHWREDITKETILLSIKSSKTKKEAAAKIGICADTMRARMKHYGIYEEQNKCHQ